MVGVDVRGRRLLDGQRDPDRGDGGTIIVDTTTKLDDAQAVKAAFAKISGAPVRAIIYTHSHPDHTGGASVFAGTDRPEIYSHQLLPRGRPVPAARSAAAIDRRLAGRRERVTSRSTW